MRLRFLFPLVGLVTCSLMTVACTDDGTDDDGAGGAGGEAPTPGAGTHSGGEPGAAGTPGAGGDCATDGSGTVVLEVTGLPAGVAPDVELVGPDERHPMVAGTLEDVGAGEYTIKANRVFDEDSTVRSVFDATVTTPSVCVGDGSTTVKVTYAAIPTSNKLWMPGLDPELVGFSSADIAEDVMTEPTVGVKTVGVGAIAFDRDGNLWATGTIIGEDMLVRFPASELAESGAHDPDIRIKVPEIECFPYINHITFDGQGNLWLSACDDGLHRVAANDLKTSGDKESDVLFTEVTNNTALAFDLAGNLWVGGGPTLLRFDAARLGSSDTDAADAAISIEDARDKFVLGSEELAFDKAGNLWGISGSEVFQLASADLEATGAQTVKANVSFTIDPLALPSTPAFDDSNALWMSFTNGGFAKFDPAKLVTKPKGMNVDPDVMITSSAITSTLPLAFFPAPQGLPLYHSIPEE